MRSDPSENGGLFIGRRPGTAPVRFGALPKLGSPLRQRVDRHLANILLSSEGALSLACWGPIPIGCLWIGSEIDYLSGSVSLGLASAFIGLFALLFGALSILRRIDEMWILIRRAAGHDQRTGVLGRVFATTAGLAAASFTVWFLVIHGPGSTLLSTGLIAIAGNW